MGKWAWSWNPLEQWKCSRNVPLLGLYAFQPKEFWQQIMQGKYVDKPWQKHTGSLQELIIPGQEKESDVNSQEVGFKPRALDSASTSLSFWLISTWREVLTLTLRNWWPRSQTLGHPGFFRTGICSECWFSKLNKAFPRAWFYTSDVRDETYKGAGSFWSFPCLVLRSSWCTGLSGLSWLASILLQRQAFSTRPEWCPRKEDFRIPALT